ncbi:hypothetical protein FM076_06120 [Streptomyces albus subsp. chlorinus]|uniref:hypothetical protein n=1 Tax=Streptomyces albus TaxID=1888 RepID=UPI00156DEF0B|nr:hypothetical protein [Streptomyces albus]NSC20802.1 hypothetical protein [Streptomyces albus subsp. chlorinus]
MRRSVTVVRMCVHAFALLLSLLLAAEGASALPAPGGERTSVAVTQVNKPGEVEHEGNTFHARRAVRLPSAPPPPGEHPSPGGRRPSPAHTAPHPAPLPETGSAGMPWSRSVEVPVLHQVFRH